MTPEEYLKASGWRCAAGTVRHTLTAEVRDPWEHPRHGHMGLAEAVEAQLAEDRARLAFVLDHSTVTLSHFRDRGHNVREYFENVEAALTVKR